MAFASIRRYCHALYRIEYVGYILLTTGSIGLSAALISLLTATNSTRASRPITPAHAVRNLTYLYLLTTAVARFQQRLSI